MGLKETTRSRVIVHPHDHVVYVAALGHVWGPTPRGDLPVGVRRQEPKSTRPARLSMDPNNPRVLYAAFWQAYRQPWTLESGGPAARCTSRPTATRGRS